MKVFRVQLTVLVILSSLLSNGQQISSDYLVGKWGICYSIDSLDARCEKPFNYFTLKPNGQYQGRDMVCMDEKISIIGSWQFMNGSLIITPSANSCNQLNPSVYSVLQFINKDFFYQKVLDTAENVGRVVYFTFRRLD